MQTKPLLIGITGAFGSGKTTASSFFASKGFTEIPLSAFLEAEAKKRNNNTITRKMLQDIGNEWRESLGPGILAQKALNLAKEKKLQHVVVDGIRNLGEVDVLRKEESFILIAVVANRTVRFDRLKANPRRETLTWELFTKLDERDLGVGEKTSGLQGGMCIALADVFIVNNGSRKELEEKMVAVLQHYA